MHTYHFPPVSQPNEAGIDAASVPITLRRATPHAVPCEFTAGTPLAATHLLASMTRALHGETMRTQAPIPFRNRTYWEVACECVRLGEQVFAVFHLAEPAVSTRGQLSLW